MGQTIFANETKPARNLQLDPKYKHKYLQKSLFFLHICKSNLIRAEIIGQSFFELSLVA